MKVTEVIHEALKGNIRQAIKKVCAEHYKNGHNASALTAESFQKDLVSRIMEVKATFENDGALGRDGDSV